MADVASITGLMMDFTNGITRDGETGELSSCVFHYSWTNGQTNYDGIEVVYTKWDNTKKKWDTKGIPDTPIAGDDTSWDYDILGTGWTPSCKGVASIKATFTPFKTISGKKKKAKSTSHTFTFTKVNNIVLPTLRNEKLDDAEVPTWRFSWSQDRARLTEAEKEKYDKTIIYRAKYMTVTLDPKDAKNASTAFNKKNTEGVTPYYGSPSYGYCNVVETAGKYEWFGVWFETLAGPSKNFSNIYADNSGPQIPLINTNQGKTNLKGNRLTLTYTLQAGKDNAVNVAYIKVLTGTPASCPAGSYLLKDLALPADTREEDWVTVKTINPKNKYANTTSTDTIYLNDNQVPDNNEVIWVKIISTNGGTEVPSAAYCVGGQKLQQPTTVVCNINEGTSTITCSVEPYTAFPNARVAVLENNGAKITTLGILSPDDYDETTGKWKAETFNYVPAAENAEIKFSMAAFFGKSYASAVLKSDLTWQEGQQIISPENVNVEAADGISGAMTVTWHTRWDGATGAELSWSDHEDAWYSNEGPSTATYDTTNPYPSFNLRGLTAGDYYLKIRTTKNGGTTYSEYTQANQWPFHYATTPEQSAVSVEPENVAPEDTSSIRLSWAFKSDDNSTQSKATIYEVVNNELQYIDSVDGEATSLTINPWSTENNKLDPNPYDPDKWKSGTVHKFIVITESSVGKVSAQSTDDKYCGKVTVLDPPSLPQSFDPGTSQDVFIAGFQNGKLVEMPIFIKLAEVVNSDTVKLVIKRMGELVSPNRPDELPNDGFDEEVIFSTYREGSNLDIYNDNPSLKGILIQNDDIIGHLDDGCTYKMFLTITNSNKMKATINCSFKVEWTKQAFKPRGCLMTKLDDTSYSPIILEPLPNELLPENNGNVFDIYRITTDRPRLIVSGGVYGQRYVDPYPTVGCGYRIVDRTINNDWICGTEVINVEDETTHEIVSTTITGQPSWIDVYPTTFDISFRGILINYLSSNSTRRETTKATDVILNLPFNVNLSNTWNKDFQSTKYLNGRVVGDWNSGIEHTVSISTDVIRKITEELKEVDSENVLNEDLVEDLRDLANYAGICHVRAQDGSSFSANVNVGETRNFNDKLNNYSLDITEVEGESLDGYLYNEGE